jgi:hypothetical protein
VNQAAVDAELLHAAHRIGGVRQKAARGLWPVACRLWRL